MVLMFIMPIYLLVNSPSLGLTIFHSDPLLYLRCLLFLTFSSIFAIICEASNVDVSVLNPFWLLSVRPV